MAEKTTKKLGQPQKRELHTDEMKRVRMRILPEQDVLFKEALKANNQTMQAAFEEWVEAYIMKHHPDNK